MNTKNFRFHMPVAVHYGVGIAHNMTGRIRGERVMIVCDPFLYQSGVAEKLGGDIEAAIQQLACKRETKTES